MKNSNVLRKILIMVLALALVFTTSAVSAFATEEVSLTDGVTIINENTSDKTFNIDGTKAVCFDGTGSDIVVENCTFVMSGTNVKLQGFNNSYFAKLSSKGNVTFKNCTFTADGVAKNGSGTDAVMSTLSGNVTYDNCTIAITGATGQGMGFYGGTTTINNTDINFQGTKAWCWAIYGSAVVTCDNLTFVENGQAAEVRNTNGIYSESTGAITFKDSKVNIENNTAGGFAPNNAKVYVDNTELTVCNNAGNGSNGGYWTITNGSVVKFNGNGTNGFSIKGVNISDSSLEVKHNGYGGLIINNITDCDVDTNNFKALVANNSTIDVQCNGERLYNYTGCDTFIRANVEFNNCPYVMLGNVGHYYSPTKVCTVNNNGCDYFLATTVANQYKTGNFAGEIVLPEITEAQDEVVLFVLDGFFKAITSASADANIGDVVDWSEFAVIDNISTVKLADLCHHDYDFENGVILQDPSETAYGVMQYECKGACEDYASYGNGAARCTGAYIYAPLVAVEFIPNTEMTEDEKVNDDMVTSMPMDKTDLEAGTKLPEIDEVPVLDGYVFDGWYLDPECKVPYSADLTLTDPVTKLYASWVKEDPKNEEGDDDPSDDPAKNKDGNAKTGDATPLALLFVLMGVAIVTMGAAAYKKHK